jgi:hypothetical protein
MSGSYPSRRPVFTGTGLAGGGSYDYAAGARVSASWHETGDIPTALAGPTLPTSANTGLESRPVRSGRAPAWRTWG